MVRVHCDFEGKCKNKAFREVYPSLIKGSRKSGWNYLCRKHFYEEQKRLKELGKNFPWSGFKKIDYIRDNKLKKISHG
nr:hypothetical protein [Candidatus Woesearchaeota archaeon]